MTAYYKKHPLPLLLLLLSLTLLTACSEERPSAAQTIAPFSDMNWESTVEDILASSTEPYDSYDSVYGGLCYTFPCPYQDKEGIVKYMLDENDRLLCIAWTFSATSSDELQSLYQSIHGQLQEQYGDGGYNTDAGTNYGDVWYLESGDIVLTAMDTSENKALQYAYLHPEASKQ